MVKKGQHFSGVETRTRNEQSRLYGSSEAGRYEGYVMTLNSGKKMATTKLNYGFSTVMPQTTTSAAEKRSKEDISLSMSVRKPTNKKSANITAIQNSIREIKKNASLAEKQSTPRY